MNFICYWLLISYSLTFRFIAAFASGLFSNIEVQAVTQQFFHRKYDFFYKFDGTVLLNDVDVSVGIGEKDVRYQISGTLKFSTVWENPSNELEKLLHLQILSLKLKLKSRKTQYGVQFEPRKSEIEIARNNPFLVHWTNYSVYRIYIDPEEDVSIINLKKAISSLLQFQTEGTDTNETDTSGFCQVSYARLDDKNVRKRKRNCILNYPDIRYHSEKMLSVDVVSEHDALYQFSDDNSYFARITSYESHKMKLNLDYNIGAEVTSSLDLIFYDIQERTIINLRSSLFQDAIKEAETNFKCKLEEKNLLLQEPQIEPQHSALQMLVKENRDNLKEENLGTMKSAQSFLTVLKAARCAKEQEIMKVIKNSKNKAILKQLVDIFGATQMLESHNAIKKCFKFDDPANLDVLERYLWSLSTGCCPSQELIKDLIDLWINKPPNKKLQATLILALTSMAHKLPTTEKHNAKIKEEVFLLVIDGIVECENDDCVVLHLQGLKNLKEPRCKTVLINYALTGSRIVSVASMKTLYSLSSVYWDNDVLSMADNIFYQKSKRYDSSARTIASDILLEGNPNRKTLRNLLLFLISHDPCYEIKKYVLQRIMQISSIDNQFAKDVQAILISENMNHYGTFAQRGLSNAFTTEFFEYSGINATLYSVNEVSKGIVKRSAISVSLQRDINNIFKLFSLGIFTSGLASFMWSGESSSDDDPEEPEDTAAGLELTVFGTQIRPFVFFSSHGELMGHIWSGTASERTPAFQAIALLHDHHQLLPLATGSIVHLNLLGASSFELAGQIQFSIWNRNAHSLVETLSGTSIYGSATIRTSFVNIETEFHLGSEVKLDLLSDLDFYNEIALCLQLSQPDFLVQYNAHKLIHLPDTKYKLKKKKEKSFSVAGRTYALGSKNNEMCNTIFHS